MIPFALDDTIVAPATAPAAAALAIVRLSGADAFELVRVIAPGAAVPATFPVVRRVCLEPFARTRVPADVVWFRGPRSYTGQDVAELQLPGCRPLVELVVERLVAAGARRAQAGEFAARAHLNGKLSEEQVAALAALVAARSAAEARLACRGLRSQRLADVTAIAERLLDVLAQLEAGFDFVDEEDVSFIDAAALRTALTEIDEQLAAFQPADAVRRRAALPHVLLAGAPNAGKSTLLNVLAHEERALVSERVGTTRDVLSVELDSGDFVYVVQDAAGLGESVDALDAAAQGATRVALREADLVVWLEDLSDGTRKTRQATEPTALLSELEPERVLRVGTKLDLAPVPDAVGDDVEFRISALTGAGLDAFRNALRTRLSAVPTRESGTNLGAGQLVEARAALSRARLLVEESECLGAVEDVLALELRGVYEALVGMGGRATTEAVLGRIFAQFCIGK